MSDKKYEKVSLHMNRDEKDHFDFLKKKGFNVSGLLKGFLKEQALKNGYVEKDSALWSFDPISGVPLVWKTNNLKDIALDKAFHALSPEDQYLVYMQGDDVMEFAMRKESK